MTREGQNNPALIIIIIIIKKYGLEAAYAGKGEKKKGKKTRKIVWADCQRLNLSQRG